MIALVMKMMMKDVCKECELTKKAVEYYQKQGLIHPDVGDNGYRNYSADDMAALKEIALLRKLGMGVTDIKEILASKNKPAALSKCKYRMELELQKSTAQLDCLKQLMDQYDIERAMVYTEEHIDENLTIKEKLLQVFPGCYGLYLSIHFGPFLNSRVDSEEKAAAYSRIIRYLDDVSNLDFPVELAEYLAQGFELMQKTGMESVNAAVMDAVDDIDRYWEEHQEELETYFRFCHSEEYQNSPAYQMRKLLMQFQQNSGYYGVFIENLKILSPSYRAYIEKLENANQRFMEKYPEAKELDR